MPRPIPVPVRQKLYERALRGESTASLAAAFRLPVRTVRHLCRRFRERGADAIRPDYHAPDPLPHAFGAERREAALALRRAHPTWGAVLIRVALGQQDPKADWPSATTLRRWFRQAGLAPAPPPPRRPRPTSTARATIPHQTWQMDASEHLALADGSQVSWLRIVDECTAAVLGTVIFPRAFWSQVEPRATQTTLRALFARWGLPERLRVDNGTPWGSQGDLPTDLVCWLAGLRVNVMANPPRRPEDNGVVERSQGVGQAWGEPWLCRSTRELQRRMDELDRWQRKLYPAVAGMPRMQAYPGLKHSGRCYDPAREGKMWDLRAAWDLMALHLVPRDVSSQGKVSLYNRPYNVGLRWAGRTTWVGFDAEAGAWTFQDEAGHEIRRQVAPELSADRIQMLEVTNRRRGMHAAKPRAPTTPAKPTGS